VSGSCCSQQYSNLYLFPATVGTTVTVIGAAGYDNPGTATATSRVATEGVTITRTAVSGLDASNSLASGSPSTPGVNTVAIGVGAGLGAALLLVGLILVIWIWRKRDRNRQLPVGGAATAGAGPLRAATTTGKAGGRARRICSSCK